MAGTEIKVTQRACTYIEFAVPAGTTVMELWVMLGETKGSGYTLRTNKVLSFGYEIVSEVK
jgi:hypothetical protein